MKSESVENQRIFVKKINNESRKLTKKCTKYKIENCVELVKVFIIRCNKQKELAIKYSNLIVANFCEDESMTWAMRIRLFSDNYQIPYKFSTIDIHQIDIGNYNQWFPNQSKFINSGAICFEASDAVLKTNNHSDASSPLEEMINNTKKYEKDCLQKQSFSLSNNFQELVKLVEGRIYKTMNRVEIKEEYQVNKILCHRNYNNETTNLKNNIPNTHYFKSQKNNTSKIIDKGLVNILNMNSKSLKLV